MNAAFTAHIWLCSAALLFACTACSSTDASGDGGAEDADGFSQGDEPASDADGDGADPGDGDQDQPEIWAWCPASSEFHGDTWDWSILATEAALYCAHCQTSADSSTLPFELDRKSELIIVPGDYPLPSAPGTYPYRLPVCFRFAESDAQPLLGDVGTLTVDQSLRNGIPFLDYTLEQPMQTDSGGSWLFRVRLRKPASDGQTTFRLDGTFSDPAADVSVAFRICELPCGFGDDLREFASCHFEGVSPERHSLVFDGGRVDLLLRISPGYTLIGQLPALFASAEGELDGQAFTQTDYWKLVFTGGIQHYMNRHFLVLFDTPIGPACGLKAENLDVWISDPPARLTTIDCNLDEIDARPISGETWEELP